MSRPTDQQIDISVANMLRIGVSLAAVIVFVGGVLLLHAPPHLAPNYGRFEEGNPALRTLTGIVQGTIDFAPRSVIQLGLVVLIATPVARVMMCVVGFARQKDRLYVGVSLIVLAVLLYSLLKGAH